MKNLRELLDSVCALEETSPMEWDSQMASFALEDCFVQWRGSSESRYYSILNALVRVKRPLKILELGTFRGVSTLFMLRGLEPDATLITVDVEPGVPPALAGIDDPRLVMLKGDDLVARTFDGLDLSGIDLLFVDTLHTSKQVLAELDRFKQHLAKGALIVLDDIHLNADMHSYWTSLAGPKLDTGTRFHWSGFGLIAPEALNKPCKAPTETRLGVCYCVHDDSTYLAESIASFKSAGPVVALVSRVPWSGEAGDWEHSAEIANRCGAEVVLGDWPGESVHRQAALAEMRARGFTHIITPDGDEIIEELLLGNLVKIAHAEIADRVYIRWDTYWKSPEYVIRPREAFTPLMLLDLRNADHVYRRDYEGGRPLVLSEGHGLAHHLSYSGPDSRIYKKITTWGHKDEVLRDWYEKVWLAWDENRMMRNLHPTHPQAYGFTERIAVPKILEGAFEAFKEACPTEALGSPVLQPNTAWPKVSVVIPLHGGPEDLKACLDSLKQCKDLLHEVLVVDDKSPDDAPELVKHYPFARLITQETNLGFGATCNRGFAESTGAVVIYLNSDTVVPRSGLVRLVESLMASGSIAASGPMTNCAGHFQQVPATYTTIVRAHLFADDFAATNLPDEDTDMLTGFCLAVRCSVIEEVGGFDESFGRGLFEDNDLCYRLRRAGYRLVLSRRSFVHHEGSKSLRRMNEKPSDVFERNRIHFERKWERDIQLGYASHLPGMGAARIHFDEPRKPELRTKEVEKLARKADISLCMIARDEERVLGACLESARPFFKEIILVDTGSKDRTKEIALEHGAKLFEMEWPDSFAIARNESLKHATGKWIYWMDADDTLPWHCGEALLGAALNAPKEVVGFIVPVQFVDDGPGGGTRVDHVKLMRHVPGLAFEGRIHEQILGSLRKAGGEIARCDAYVLHSGYDTSEAGQAKKRTRDEKLLLLDLEDRPGHPFVLFNLGMTAHYTNDHEGAVDWLTKSLEASQDSESHVRKACALLGVSYRELGKMDEALKVFEDGLKRVGEDPELRFQKALLLTRLERFEEAAKEYEAMPTTVDSHFSSVDVGILGFKRQHNLGSVYMAMGKYDQAKACWDKALTEAPQFLPSAFEWFDAALKEKDMPSTERALNHVLDCEGPCESWAKMLMRHAETLGGRPNVEPALRRALDRFQGAPALRMALVKRLLEDERLQEAAPILDGLYKDGSAEAAYYMGVTHVRVGDFAGALAWMKRAQELNPNHLETAEQIAKLEALLSQEPGA